MQIADNGIQHSRSILARNQTVKKVHTPFIRTCRRLEPERKRKISQPTPMLQSSKEDKTTIGDAVCLTYLHLPAYAVRQIGVTCGGGRRLMQG
jgi:hypothetical protein